MKISTKSNIETTKKPMLGMYQVVMPSIARRNIMNKKQKIGLRIILLMLALYTFTLSGLLLYGTFFPSNVMAYTIGFCALLVFINPIPMAIVWVKLVRTKKGIVRTIGSYFVFTVLLLSATFVATIFAAIIIAVLFAIFH
jgi:hypothetical protein